MPTVQVQDRLRPSVKPPYRIPPMAEIAAMPRNGLKVVSTFSGCGGSCLGYTMAGYKVLWANDFHPNARASYQANFPDTIHDARSIREVKPEDILEATGLRRGELDLFDGSPPCQSFSSAGSKEKKWGKLSTYSDGTQQRNDDLFIEYARILTGLQPRAFVAENVKGLTIGTAKGYLVEIVKMLKACGYKVDVRLLNARELGVPQSRPRLIFIGVREDLGLAPEFPRKLPYSYTMADACPWLGGSTYVRTKHGYFDGDGRPCSTKEANPITASGGQRWSSECLVPPGAAIPPAIVAKVGKNKHCSYIMDNAAKKHSETICAMVGPYAPGIVDGGIPHPDDVGIDEVDREIVLASGYLLKRIGPQAGKPRFFTILEVKRLCGFPDDFVLLGPRKERWARLGNAVVPPMAAAVGRALAEGVLLK